MLKQISHIIHGTERMHNLILLGEMAHVDQIVAFSFQ